MSKFCVKAVLGLLLGWTLVGCDNIGGLFGPSESELEQEVSERLVSMVGDAVEDFARVDEVKEVDLIRKNGNEYTGIGTVRLTSKNGSRTEDVRYSLSVVVDVKLSKGSWEAMIQGEPMDKDKLLKLSLGGLSNLFD